MENFYDSDQNHFVPLYLYWKAKSVSAGVMWELTYSLDTQNEYKIKSDADIKKFYSKLEKTLKELSKS